MFLLKQYGNKVVVDSAFLAKNASHIIKTSQSLTQAKSRYDATVKTQATSMYQTSEWGMRTFKASLPCMEDRILYKKCGEKN